MADQRLLNMAIAATEEGAKPKGTLSEEDKKFIEAALSQPSSADLMKEQIARYIADDATVEDKRAALEELQFYVEDGYNASDLHKLGGVDIAISALNNDDSEIRLNGAWVLATSMFHNEEGQRVVAERHGQQVLLERLAIEEDPKVSAKLVYGLSAFISSNPKNAEELLDRRVIPALLSVVAKEGSEFEASVKKAVFVISNLTTAHRDRVRAEVMDNPDFAACIVTQLKSARDPDLVDKTLTLTKKLSIGNADMRGKFVDAGLPAALDEARSTLTDKEHGFNMEDAVAVCDELTTFYRGQ